MIMQLIEYNFLDIFQTLSLSLSLSLSLQLSLLARFARILVPLNSSYYFLIVKIDFMGVSIIQTSHLSFNEANIR